MKLFLAPYLAAIAASVLAVNNGVADASIAHSSFALGQKASFGISKNILNKIPRGGAEEETEAEVSEEPEVLYLPGLLEASIVKNAQVCVYCLLGLCIALLLSPR